MLRAMIAAVLHLGMVGAAHAQMPVPLLDNEPAAPNPAADREDLPEHQAIRALLPHKPIGEDMRPPETEKARCYRVPAGIEELDD